MIQRCLGLTLEESRPKSRTQELTFENYETCIKINAWE